MLVKTLHIGDAGSISREVLQKHINRQTGKNKGIVFAGDLNLRQDDILQKKIKDQKNAMKTILDQFQRDNRVDDSMGKIKTHQQELDAELKFTAEQYNSYKELRQELRVTYGMTDESEEEENLSLLEKSIYGDEELTEEERAKLSSMGPLTEYQQAALQYDAMMKIWEIKINQLKNGISNDAKSIISIKLELLKSHPMVDAQKEAAKLMEKVLKEIISMLVDEAKDKFDEKQEEQEEITKEKQKKVQEEAEKLQKLKEDKERKEPGRSEGGSVPDLMITDTVTVEAADLKQIRQDTLSELMLEARKNMLDEDTKGIAVDEYL